MFVCSAIAPSLRSRKRVLPANERAQRIRRWQPTATTARCHGRPSWCGAPPFASNVSSSPCSLMSAGDAPDTASINARLPGKLSQFHAVMANGSWRLVTRNPVSATRQVTRASYSFERICCSVLGRWHARTNLAYGRSWLWSKTAV